MATDDEREQYLKQWREQEDEMRAKRIRARLDNRTPESDASKPVTPLELARLRRIGELAIAQMAETVCKGDRANVYDCTPRVEECCPHREHNSCPKVIMRHEERVQRYRKGDRPEVALCKVYEGQGIPRPIAHQLAENEFVDSPAIQVVEGWWRTNPRPRVLAVTGPTDNGKTFACAMLCSRFGGRFVHVSRLREKLKERGFLESLRVPGLLVLDDLGSESIDWFEETKGAVSSVLCERIDGGQFTLLPMNLAAKEIRARYGDRLADRVKKLGDVKTVDGPSLRSLSRWRGIDHVEEVSIP